MSALSFGHTGYGIISEQASLLPSTVGEYQTVAVKVPAQQLADRSLQVFTSDHTSYSEWTARDHYNSFAMLQKVVTVWKETGIANQHLVYGKVQLDRVAVPFNWEIVPYYKPSTIIGSLWQQFCVLWKISFGGSTLSETQQKNQIRDYKKLFEESQNVPETVHTTAIGNDPFCKPEVINKQAVLEGRTVIELLKTDINHRFFSIFLLCDLKNRR